MLHTLAPHVSNVEVDTLWLLVAAALVLLMTPGVAVFYGGLVRATSVVSMMMMSFGAMALIAVLWVVYGYGMTFGTPLIPHWIGDPLSEVGLAGLVGEGTRIDMHGLAFAGFQATFAILAVALVSGAIADRARFGSWMLFAGLWATLVYFPVAYWIFNKADGWAAALGVNDFAGGIVVDVTSGTGALALALVLGKRIGFRKGIERPHNVPLTMLGAGILWFGWFGFNGGSAGGVDGTTALVWVNTLVAPAASTLTWLVVERLRSGKPTSVGAAAGAVAGLVAITPAGNALTPGWALLLGAIAGVLCALAVQLKYVLGFDDSLDVVGLHLVGGLVGALLVGVVGTGIGLTATGSARQLGVQALVALTVAAYSFGAAWLIGAGIQKTIGFRIRGEDEIAGVDAAVHGEDGYTLEADEEHTVEYHREHP